MQRSELAQGAAIIMLGNQPVVQCSTSKGIGVDKTGNLWYEPDFVQENKQNPFEKFVLLDCECSSCKL